MRTERQGCEVLAGALRDEGGTVATLVAPGAGADQPGPAQVAASGPRARGNEAEYELLIEMILEGSRLHYGQPRVIQTDDPDLALLIGDQLYALGLVRLAALGDLQAVAALADVISRLAEVHAEGDQALADEVWRAGAEAVGWGHDGDRAASG